MKSHPRTVRTRRALVMGVAGFALLGGCAGHPKPKRNQKPPHPDAARYQTWQHIDSLQQRLDRIQRDGTPPSPR